MDQNRGFVVDLVVVELLMAGLVAAFQSNIRIAIPSAPSSPQIFLTPSEDIELERKYGNSRPS